MEKKTQTINIIKQKRKVPENVNEERKKYNTIKKAIIAALKDEAKTIPQIASLTKFSLSEITYYLMTMLKFGEVCVQRLDDMDEYYFYELKKK